MDEFIASDSDETSMSLSSEEEKRCFCLSLFSKLILHFCNISVQCDSTILPGLIVKLNIVILFIMQNGKILSTSGLDVLRSKTTWIVENNIHTSAEKA